MKKNNSALISVCAESSVTLDAVINALETIGHITPASPHDLIVNLSPETNQQRSFRLILPAPTDNHHMIARTELADAEYQHIRSVLDRFEWRCSVSAKALGIDRSTLYRKMKKYSLSRNT